MSTVISALIRQSDAPGLPVALSDRYQVVDPARGVCLIECIADELRRYKVRVLAISADNSPDWVLVDLAAQRAGVVVVPLAPFFSAEQVAHILEDSGVDAIAADEAGSGALQSLPTRYACELTQHVTLLQVMQPRRAVSMLPGTARISYTSGTTGRPKGVCLSNNTVERVAGSLHYATRSLGIERHLCLLPLATLLENVAGVYAPLLAGAEVVLPSLAETGIQGGSGFDVSQLLHCINEYRPGSIIMLPQLLSGLVSAAERGAKLPATLKFVAVGGGVVGEGLLERADAVGIPVFEGYGLTECGSVVALNTPAARRRGSVGRPLPHSRVRISEDSEVMVGGAVMTGYLGDQEAFEGEIATGDIGHFDADGYLYISGRKKNVLITSYGRNLSPEWVEAALNAAPSIAQSAVVGDGRPWNVAVIVPMPGADAASVLSDVAAVNRTLPDYARITDRIIADAAFSTRNGLATPNGRIRRDAIERYYAQAIDACYQEQARNAHGLL